MPAIVTFYPDSDASRLIDRFGGGNRFGVPSHVFTSRGYAVLYVHVKPGPGAFWTSSPGTSAHHNASRWAAPRMGIRRAQMVLDDPNSPNQNDLSLQRPAIDTVGVLVQS